MANDELQRMVVNIEMNSAGFQEGISVINRQMRISKDEFRLASIQSSQFGDSTELLGKRSQSLSQQLDLSKQKVGILAKAYEESRQKSGENTKATDDLRLKLLAAQRQEASLENQLKQVNNELNNQKREFDSTGSSAGGFSRILQNAFSVTLGMGFFDMIKTGFNYAKEASFGFNSSLEQNRIAFTTMMGSAEKANEYIQGMLEFSSRTPFEFTDLAEGSKLLMAFGFEAEKLPGMLKAIGDASSGLGMSGSEGLQRIGLQLGQMNTLGKATYQDLKQLAQAGVPVWDILSEAIGKSTGEVQEMVSKGLLPATETIDVLIAGMSERFPNMMEEQSKSWQGLMSSIKDNLSIAFGTSTQEVFEYLKGHLETISEKLQEFNAVLKDQGLRAALETFIPPLLLDGLELLKDGLTWVIEHGAIVKATAIGIAAGFATIKLTKLITDVGGLSGMFTKLTGVFNIATLKTMAIGAVIAVLAGAAYMLYRNWEHVAPFFSSMWDVIDNSFKTAGNAIMVVLRGLQVGLAEYLSFTLGNLTKMVSKMLDIFSHIPGIGGAFETAKVGVDKLSKGIDDFVDSSRKSLDDAIANTKNSASEVAKSWDNMKEAGSNMTQAIGDDLSGLVSKSKETFKSMGDTSDFDTSILSMEEAGGNLVEAIGKGVEDKEKSAKAKVKTVVEGISDEMNTAVYLIDREIKKLLDDSSDLEQYQINLGMAMELTTQKIKILEAEFDRLSQVKEVNKNVLMQLTKEIDRAKDAYDDLGKKIVDVTEKIRDANIKTANQFVEQIKGALKRRYEEERDIRETELNNEIKDLDNWKDESIKRINDVYDHKIKLIEDSSNAQINALNAELQALDRYEKDKSRAEQDEEDLTKINRLKDAIDYEHNEFNKAQLKKELSNAEKDFAKRKEQEKLQDKKEAIKQEIANVREKARQETEILKARQQEELTSIQELYQANKDTLQLQLADLREFYKIKTKDAELQAEAEYMIIKDLQEDIMDLLYQYTDHYKAVGQTFGDKMVEGFAPMIDKIHEMIDEVMARISSARKMQLSVPQVNTSLTGSSSNNWPSNVPVGSEWNEDGTFKQYIFQTTVNSPIARTASQERREVEISQRNMIFSAGLA